MAPITCTFARPSRSLVFISSSKFNIIGARLSRSRQKIFLRDAEITSTPLSCFSSVDANLNGAQMLWQMRPANLRTLDLEERNYPFRQLMLQGSLLLGIWDVELL